MRRGRLIAIALAAAAALLAVPSALGASPQQITKDLADNGKLNGTYSAQELKSAFKNPSVLGYGSPSAQVQDVVVVLSAQRTESRPRQGVLGAQRTVQPRARSPLTATRRSGSLPFTGAELGFFAAVGLALVGSGLVVRRAARARG